MKYYLSCFLLLAVFASSLVLTLTDVVAAGNRYGTAVGQNYFTGSTSGSITGTVLPESNASGSACSGYGYAAWNAAGRPTNTNNFAIPTGAVRSGGTQEQRKADLLNYLRTTYNAGSLASGATCLQRQKRIGAAFVVKTLLGINSPTSRSVSAAQWNELELRLSNPAITISSESRTSNFNSARVHNSTTVIDVRFYNMSSAQTEPTIVIRNGSSIVYELRRRCGNPFGAGAGLPTYTPTNWNYVHNTYSINRSTSTSTSPGTSFRYAPGTSFTIRNQIRNNGNGRGNSYTHQIQVSTNGGSSWSNIMNRSETAINAGSNKTERSATYSLPGNVQNDTVVCFRGRISPFRGQSEPTLNNTGHPSGSGTGWRYTATRCVRVYITPPSITSASANCNTFTYQFSGQSGNTYRARLQELVDGSWVYRGSWNNNLSPGGSSKTFDLQPYRDFGSRTFRVRVEYTGNMQGISAVHTGSRTVGPCASISCGNLTTSPNNVEAGTPFSATFNFGVSNLGSNARSRSFTVFISGSGVSNTGQMTASPSTITFSNQDSARSGITRNNLVVNSAGEYELSVRVNNLNPNPLDCPGSGDEYTVNAYDKPYVSAFGADVMATNGFVGACDSSNPGVISALFDTDRTHGSGAQFAALAMSQISQFASAKMRNTVPQPTKGLTFANSGSSVANSTYGGGYQSPSCTQDYFGQMPDATPTTNNLASIINGSSGVYFRDGGFVTDTGNNTLSNGKDIALYVNGDVQLRRNVRYASDSWSNTGQIPSFYLVVSGDIYIDSSIERLDGIYIAQPRSDGTGGNIYTCASGAAAVVLSSAYDDCTTALQVNGAFIASNVFLNRYASSSLRFGSPGEFPYNSNETCEGGVSRSVCAAETFNFSPELYLTNPAIPSTGAPGQSRYDSITSLPPIL